MRLQDSDLLGADVSIPYRFTIKSFGPKCKRESLGS